MAAGEAEQGSQEGGKGSCQDSQEGGQESSQEHGS